MASEERKSSPSESIHDAIFSPRFKSLAAMAGWDEDSLLFASLIVDDTPDRELNHKKRTVFQFKTPPSTNSRKKRRAQNSPVVSVPIVALNLDDIEAPKSETQKDTPKAKIKEKEKERAILEEKNPGVSTSLPCMDKLREELSCAICLDICFEPSTTPCGHSFCLKCLRFSASKCGKKCPKCRQLISNGRSCTVNTVLWNTIQLLFPQEVEAKKAAGGLNSRESERPRKIPETAFYDNLRNESSENSELPRSEETSMRRRRSTQSSRNVDPTASLEREIRRSIRASSRASSRDSGARTGRAIPSQDEDAALALRLQREEFMGAVRGTNTIQSSTSTNLISTNPTNTNNSLSLARGTTTFNQSSTSTNPSTSGSSFSLARANLRAMASRAIMLRVRRQL